MTLNNIFNQLMVIYGKPTPDAMHQNNLNFLAPDNPQDPPKLLFKRCADCQKIAIIAKVPYTYKQLLMNAIDLLTRCGMNTPDMEDWDRRVDTNKTWLHLCPFIQTAYQRRLQTVATTAAQGRYTNSLQASPQKTRSPATTRQRQLRKQSICTWQTYLHRLLHPSRPT
jgi:hypothetical protein